MLKEKHSEVEHKKWLFRTYIFPMRPEYCDIKHMYLAGIGHALAGILSVIMHNVGFEPTSRCNYTQNDNLKSIPT